MATTVDCALAANVFLGVLYVRTTANSASAEANDGPLLLEAVIDYNSTSVSNGTCWAYAKDARSIHVRPAIEPAKLVLNMARPAFKLAAKVEPPLNLSPSFSFVY